MSELIFLPVTDQGNSDDAVAYVDRECLSGHKLGDHIRVHRLISTDGYIGRGAVVLWDKPESLTLVEYL